MIHLPALREASALNTFADVRVAVYPGQSASSQQFPFRQTFACTQKISRRSHTIPLAIVKQMIVSTPFRHSRLPERGTERVGGTWPIAIQ